MTGISSCSQFTSSRQAPGADAFVPLSWPRLIGLHLLPAALAFAGALAVAPLLATWDVPESFALTVAFTALLTPIELGILMHASHRKTGSWSPARLGAVVAYTEKLGRRWLLVPPLFVVALGIAIVWSSVADTAANPFNGLLPSWLLPDYDVTEHATRIVILWTGLVTLLVDGFINPTVEELYFRAYLLPRIPLGIRAAIPVSVGLFTAQHYWQPFNWPLIFLLQLILTALIVRIRSVRLGIVMHVLTNSVGIVLGLTAALS